MALDAGDAVVGQKAAGERTVNSGRRAACPRSADRVAIVALDRQSLGLGASRRRIEQRVRRVDEMEYAGVEQLPHFVAIVAAADESGVADFAGLLEALKPIECAAGLQEMIQR